MIKHKRTFYTLWKIQKLKIWAIFFVNFFFAFWSQKYACTIFVIMKSIDKKRKVDWWRLIFPAQFLFFPSLRFVLTAQKTRVSTFSPRLCHVCRSGEASISGKKWYMGMYYKHTINYSWRDACTHDKTTLTWLHHHHHFFFCFFQDNPGLPSIVQQGMSSIYPA